MFPVRLLQSQLFFHFQKSEQSRESDGSGRAPKKNRSGTYYTPHRLAEFLLDEVLPWDGTKTSFRILDPACGSGIFLVEAYRRLVGRWQQANPGRRPAPTVLRQLLTRNLFGVDQNPEAVRVASFSLCLTMCDYIEPRHLWQRVIFPRLRERNLRAEDFLEFANSAGQRVGKFDLVVGNPPWESRLSGPARGFLAEKGYAVGDNQIAQVFLWAAPDLCKPKGELCLIAPSKGLLFNTSKPNLRFRSEFFRKFRVKTIVNFSALRKTLFANAAGPAAAVFYRPGPPGPNAHILYCCPKPWHSPEDRWHYIIEHHDISRIDADVAAENRHIWKAAMWGSPRDWELIKKLSALPCLQDLCSKRGWIHGEGFTIGTQEKKQTEAPWVTGKPLVLPGQLRRFAVDERLLGACTTTHFERPRSENRAIFQGPHLLVKQSPKAKEGLVAALLRGDAVFNHSLLGIGAAPNEEGELGALCVALATNICLYYAMFTSARWLVERDELDKNEIMSFPIPSALMRGELVVPYSELQRMAAEGDARERWLARMAQAYGLSENEIMQVNDAVRETVAALPGTCYPALARWSV